MGINLAVHSDAFIFFSICGSSNASPECCIEIVLCMLRISVFVCFFTYAHMSCVPVCANKDNSVFFLGMHPQFVCALECQSGKLPCERIGGHCVCCGHSQGGISLYLLARVLLEKEAGLATEIHLFTGTFTNPSALFPKLFLPIISHV